MRHILSTLFFVTVAKCTPIGKEDVNEFSNKRQLSRNVNVLSNKLFNALVKDNQESNVIISPMSIHFALSMLYFGASEQEQQRLQDYLGSSGVQIDQENLLSSTRDLLLHYAEKKENLTNTNIQLSNVIVADQSVQIKNEYLGLLSEYFLSTVMPANFSSPAEAASDINRWVLNKTENLIKDFLSPDAISERSRLILLNAIYFKANWMTTFDAARPEPFNIKPDQQSYLVDMMFQVAKYPYHVHSDLDCQIISLPYEDDNFTMLVFLPNQLGLDALDKLGSSLENSEYDSILSDLKDTEIVLKLPKFKLGYKAPLIRALEESGLTSFFDAEFPEITDEALKVEEFLHETSIEVTETGSEAAAITGIELGVRSGSSREPDTMTVNRPFIFVIVDKENNIPLFKGKITNPPASVFPDEENNEIEVRQNSELLQNLDPEDRANILNNPEAVQNMKPSNCSVNEYINTDKVKFPCHPKETQPIEDYKAKHGDPARHGINGEVAALAAGAN